MDKGSNLASYTNLVDRHDNVISYTYYNTYVYQECVISQYHVYVCYTTTIPHYLITEKLERDLNLAP